MIADKYDIDCRISVSGYAKKYVYRTADDILFESSCYFRPTINRFDLCVSTSAGCALGCRICQCTYSAEVYQRELRDQEIIDQIMHMMSVGERYMQNDTVVLVVFMGNGDSFQNIENVLSAISGVHSVFSGKVTRYGISTIGNNIECVNGLSELSLKEKIEIRLQLSVLTVRARDRRKLLPKALDLDCALKYLDIYAEITGTKVRYNFPMIRGLNDGKEHLDAVIKCFAGYNDKRVVRLSNYNEISNMAYQPSLDDIIYASADYLKSGGLDVEIFFSDRDSGISGSCGQMRDLAFKSIDA